MTVNESIIALNLMRESGELDLNPEEFKAIGLSIVVLASLEPSQVKLIDTLMSEPGPSSS